MTDITSKPFDWNDNFSETALEDFSGIQKSLSYGTCQTIGMALAKLELLEKQGCKVIDPSGSSSENPNKCENAISRQAAIDVIFSEPIYKSGMKKRNADEVVPAIYRKIKSLPPVNPKEETVTEFADRCRECGAYYGRLLNQKWIPVSERLPEEDGRYLACIVNEYKPTLKYIMTCDLILNSISDNHWFPDDECASNNVIAWMPLPGLYEPQERERGE